MSFLDRAKAAANDLAAKADTAMANAGISGPGLGTGAAGGAGGSAREAESTLRDYGLLVWREQHGHPVDATEKEGVVAAMRRLEGAGAFAALRVGGVVPGAAGVAGVAGALGGLFGTSTGSSASSPAPPPPGAAAAAAGAAGAPGATSQPPTPEPSGEQQTQGGHVPPPPPPSWA